MPVAIRPRAIQLEASSYCQLRCPSCPTTSGAIRPTIGRGFLQPDDFQRLLDANPDIATVELSNYGEAFLNPNLPAILQLAHERNVALSLVNGVNLNHASPEVLEGVVKFRLRLLTCSIDGASAETYRSYRVRGDFDRVIGNIRQIDDWKRRYASPFPELRWQFIVFGHNQHELPVARRLAEALGMTFVPKLSWDDDVSPPDMEVTRAIFGVANRAEYRAKHGQDYMQGICHQLWDSPQINWDGKVLGCCRNFWGDFGGNAFRDGLVPSLNTERMAHARQMLLGRAEAHDDVPCTSCSIYHEMSAAGRFLQRDDAARGQRLSPEEALTLADAAIASGRHEAAALVYQGILAAIPGHPGASRRLDGLKMAARTLPEGAPVQAQAKPHES